MKRRNFIKNTLYSSAAFASTSILTNSCNPNSSKKITILHTNDVHSHIDPFDKNNEKFALKGGVSRRATIIEKIRNENIIGKITNRALVINSSNFNLFKVERIKHIKCKI